MTTEAEGEPRVADQPALRRKPAAVHEHPGYVRMAVFLFVVTAIEVAWAFLPIRDTIMVPVLMVLIALKAAGVVMWYMHLKFESRVFRLLALGPFIVAVGLILVFFALFGGFA